MLLDDPIGSGAYSDVYAWDEGRVLKLFKDSVQADDVDYEARVVRTVRAAGLSAPTVGEMVEVNGRIGLIYEHMEGLLCLSTVRRSPRNSHAVLTY